MQSSTLHVRICIPFPICTPKPPSFSNWLSICHRAQTQNPIECARKKKRRNRSKKSTRFMLEIASLIVSNLKILPYPLDLFVREFGRANESAGRGRSLGRWRRKGKRHLLFLGFLMVCGLGLLYLTELEMNVVFGILVSGVFGFCLIQWCEKRRGVAKDLILRASFLGIFVALGFRRVDLRKWVEKTEVCNAMVEVVKGSRGRRAF